MNVTLTNILQKFKRTMVSFIDELIGIFPKDADLALLRIAINDQIPVSRIMNCCVSKRTFINKLIKVKKDEFIKNLDDESDNGLVYRAMEIGSTILPECDPMGKLKSIEKIHAMLRQMDIEEKEAVQRWLLGLNKIVDEYLLQEENKVKRE